MKGRRAVFIFLIFMVGISCTSQHEGRDVRAAVPELGESEGQRLLGNGNLLMLFGRSEIFGGEKAVLRELYIKDFTRVMIDAFHLRAEDAGRLNGFRESSWPWFAAWQQERYEQIDHEYSVFVDREKDAIIYRGTVRNRGQGRRRVNIRPEFRISRPFIYDHYESYSNVYIDEYIFTFGFKGQQIPIEFDGVAAAMELVVGAGESRSYEFVLVVDEDQNRAAAGYEELIGHEDLLEHVRHEWANWLSQGEVPQFPDSMTADIYRINLLSLKAGSLNGAVAEDIFDRRTEKGLPSMSAVAAFTSAAALLEAGHLEEAAEIMVYWDNRPMKQKGEWFSRYDAFGNAVDGELSNSYDVPEWSSNALYSSLMYHYLRKSGEIGGDLDLMRELLQFPEDRIHGNGLLHEGGLLDELAYSPFTNMAMAAAYGRAARVTAEVSRRLESDAYRIKNRALLSSIPGLYDKDRGSYVELQEDEVIWNSDVIYGWSWGYPDHAELLRSSEFFWQRARSQRGGIQRKAEDEMVDILSTSAMAAYYAFKGYGRRYDIVLEQLLGSTDCYGHFPEKVAGSEGRRSVESFSVSSPMINAAAVSAMHAGAIFGQLPGNDQLRDGYIRELRNFHFPPGTAGQQWLNEDKKDSLIAALGYNDLQILDRLESIAMEGGGLPEIELLEYEAIRSDRSPILLNLSAEIRTLGLVDSVMTDEPDISAELLTGERKIAINVPQEMGYSDEYRSLVLSIVYTYEGKRHIQQFPLFFLFRAPYLIELKDRLSPDSLKISLENRLPEEIELVEYFSPDSMGIHVKPGAAGELAIPLSDSLSPGIYPFEILVFDGFDSNFVNMEFRKFSAE